MGILYSSSSEALAATRASGQLPHHCRVDGNRRQPTVRKLARVARTTESPLAEFNEDSKGRGRLAEFNGDSESPAARTNSIETAGDRRAESQLRTSIG